MQGIWKIGFVSDPLRFEPGSGRLYESDFLSKVPLDYDCCEALNVKVNLSTISVNTSFKYLVSHIDDLKMASCSISEEETLIKEQEWRHLHTVSQHKYSTLVYTCLSIIGLYVIYKLYICCKGKAHYIRSLTDTTETGNVVNIKIHTSNESLAMAQEDVPLRELNSPNTDTMSRRSNRLHTSKSCF
jgi:hypothetical protein